MKLTVVALSMLFAGYAVAQHTIPNTWTPLIGAAQGWPQDTEGRAIHMIHVPPNDLQMNQRGKILFWGVSNTLNGPVRPTIWTPPMAWEVSNGTFADSLNTLSYEAFCCGHTLMEDGRVVIGGSNFKVGPYPREPGNEVSIYNPATNTWTELTTYPLNKKRYYPSLYRLTDGRIGTFGGQATEPDPNDPQAPPPTFVPQPYEINPNKLTLLAAWQMPVDDNWDFLNYPHLYTLSSNEWFFAGPSRHNGGGGNDNRDNYNTFYFDLSSLSPAQVPYGGLSELWEGASVMYEPGKILKAGGVEALNEDYSHEDVEATEHAERINPVISQNNKWAYAASMHRKRLDHNMVILPDGRVFAVGGTKYHKQSLRSQVVNWVQDGEIWNPATNTWTLTAAFGGGQLPNVFRGYHSAAVLMPDARVLLAGGDTAATGSPQPPSGHFYLPDYGAGTRCEITSGPNTIMIGSNNNQVVTNTGVGWYRVVLVGLGSVTHSLDSNQRWVELSLVVDGPTDDPTFHGPASTTQTPVGHYMLFVLKFESGKWLPCKMAKYVKVTEPID